MRTIEELKEQLEALESLSWSQPSLDMPKPAPSLLRGIVELLEAQQEEIKELKELLYAVPGVLDILRNEEERARERYWRS